MKNDYDKMKNLKINKTLSENYDDVFELVNKTKNIQINEDYRKSVITNFRKNLDKKSRSGERFSFKHSFALTVFVVAGYLLTSNLLNQNTDSIESTLTNMDEKEIDLILNDYDLSLTTSMNDPDANIGAIDSIYANSVYSTISDYINIENSLSIASDYEISNVETLLSDDEVDQLYGQLLEKEIL